MYRKSAKEYANLKNSATQMEISMAALAATPARFAFFSPRRFPILVTIVRHTPKITKIAANRTEVAIAREYGAWKVLATVESSTDCVANGIGPRLQAFTQWWILAVIITAYKLAATKIVCDESF